MNENYPIDRSGSLWDGLWRGRSSSHSRALTNAGFHAACCASALREAARLVDSLPTDSRALEIAGLARQIGDLSESMRACADHLLAEAGLPFEPKRRVSLFAWLRGR